MGQLIDNFFYKIPPLPFLLALFAESLKIAKRNYKLAFMKTIEIYVFKKTLL